jgi:formamidopyrimidine-DNA glycosylase
MPELPEVEHLRRTLVPHLVGARVLSANLVRSDIAQAHGVKGTPLDRTTKPQLLQGRTITSLRRLGKQLAILTDSGATMVVHLGMSGRMLIRPNTKDAPDHTHATWKFQGPTGAHALLFVDPRRFGGIWTYPSPDTLYRYRWSALGPDALDIAGDTLAKRLASSNRPIKAALLDQGILAGVGNIYADEALFRTRIHPLTESRTLSPDRVASLAEALRAILGRAVDAGGSTLRDYVDATGEPGRAQAAHLVYGRGGLPCVTCQTPLETELVAQRTTVWCPRCQAT